MAGGSAYPWDAVTLTLRFTDGHPLLVTLWATTPAGIGTPPYPGSLDPRPTLLRTGGHNGTGMAYQVMSRRFVGRSQELARLRQLLARAADGTPLVALIGGEAGVGKTRLVEQLAAARGQGVRVLRGGLDDQADPGDLHAGDGRPGGGGTAGRYQAGGDGTAGSLRV